MFRIIGAMVVYGFAAYGLREWLEKNHTSQVGDANEQ